jgi:hypothetical protein
LGSTLISPLEEVSSMSAFFSQLPALVGVVVGALASYLVTSAGERSQWRRAQQTRWDEKRAAAYAEYGYFLKRKLHAVLRLAVDRGVPLHGYAGVGGQVDEELTRAESERSAKWEMVVMLGDPDAVLAARDYTLLVLSLEKIARQRPVDPNSWDDVVRKLEVARIQFYGAVRADLGVRHGRLPDDSMWSWHLIP